MNSLKDEFFERLDFPLQCFLKTDYVTLEKEILAKLLADCASISEIKEILESSDFDLPWHGIIYEAILFCFKENGSLDLIMESDAIKGNNALDDVLSHYVKYLKDGLDLILPNDLAELKIVCEKLKTFAVCREITESAKDIIINMYEQLYSLEEEGVN